MITTEKIQRGGSKLEITREVLESGLDIPVPNSAWRYYGEDLAPLVKAFQGMRKPVIVRGSHQNDYHGFIDVVPTFREINTLSELEKAVKTIEDEMKREEVKIHCEDWQQPFSPEVHILMQEQSHSPINGAILRHPHKEEGYFVQYRDTTDNGPDRFPCSYALKGLLSHNEFYSGGFDKRPDDEIKQALGMVQRLEQSGILEKDWAYQIEFGLNPLLFFQARPFKKLQPTADFEVPWHQDQVKIWSSYVFGITPKDGIELDFIVCRPEELYYSDGVNKVNNQRESLKGRVGLIQAEKFYPNSSPEIALRTGELVCFRSPCEAYDFLFHANYRFMKKAEVSFVNADPSGLEYPRHFYDFKEFKRAKVFSNGDRGVIIPVK